MAEERERDWSHRVFQNDPVHYRSLVKELVDVKTTGGVCIQGTVYTIDPVSDSVILLRRDGDRISMDLVFGHSITSITRVSSSCLSSSQSIPDDIFNNEQKFSEAEIEHRRNLVKTWLSANRFPVVEDGNMLVLEDILVIHPPYGRDQCLSCNDTILERIQNLISSISFS